MKKIFIFLYLLIVVIASMHIQSGIDIKFNILNPDKIHNGYFYIDSGNGFSEQEKELVSYKDSVCKIHFNQNYIKNLRYDPMDDNGTIIVKNLLINGKPIDFYKFNMIPSHHIKIAIKGHQELEINSTGSDPYMMFGKDVETHYKFVGINWKLFISGIILLLFIVFDMTQRKFSINLNYKIKILNYLSMHVLILVMLLWLYLDIGNYSWIDKLFVFERILEEYIIATSLFYVFAHKNIKLYFLALSFVTVYICINAIQAISILISSQYVTKLAIANIEFIGYMVNISNLFTIFYVILLLCILPYFIVKLLNKKFSLFIMMLSVIITLIYRFDIFHVRKQMHTEQICKDLKFSAKAPIQATINLFKTQAHSYDLSDEDVKNIRKYFGIEINKTAKYPFKKEAIFTKKISFKKINTKIKRPNVIVIFTEGYSARTCNVYTNNFEHLTPHLKKFSLNPYTMIVQNYFNHTAATYRGLNGQLCSLYPTYGGVGGWHDRIGKLPKIKYNCVPQVLNLKNYNTFYLNVHYAKKSHIDEMVTHFGFKHVLSGEELSRKYLGRINSIADEALTDHQAYRVLKNFLQEYNQTQPFFIGIYTEETHAWLNSHKDGIRYKDGKNNSLNTIHNMDDAFGKFWNYFENSQYAKNTILIFTADHAHYYSKAYISAMHQNQEKNYQRIFTDKIPLLIYDPIHKLPKHLDACSATSVSLAPTILHLLGINCQNCFVGKSIFECLSYLGISSYGSDTYLIDKNKIYDNYLITDKNDELLELAKKFIRYQKHIEINNQLVK